MLDLLATNSSYSSRLQFIIESTTNVQIIFIKMPYSFYKSPVRGFLLMKKGSIYLSGNTI
ncbi:hypothetical protein FHX64_001683 [Microbacter margulisiae]|uniref:Uncharacterized protein n=1 Tax=Microbacter margulisiae TaxID=1350067 RepID=A0A7W5H295_9PORP|nr:hypothetical protein [Microbacter margulisiae]